jgi:hypothetical protein
MMYENNYELALHAQSRFPDRLRSVIVPWSGITDGELDILTRVGVVGYRITWRLDRNIDKRMIGRTAERGWSMHYLHRADERELDHWKPIIVATPAASCWNTWAASTRRRASTERASSSYSNASTLAGAG